MDCVTACTFVLLQDRWQLTVFPPTLNDVLAALTIVAPKVPHVINAPNNKLALNFLDFSS